MGVRRFNGAAPVRTRIDLASKLRAAITVFASMGPRPVRTRIAVSTVTPELFVVCFNGAAPVRTRIDDAMVRMVDEGTRFNGAAPVRTRIG